jgi:hypothetical protein
VIHLEARVDNQGYAGSTDKRMRGVVAHTCAWSEEHALMSLPFQVLEQTSEGTGDAVNLWQEVLYRALALWPIVLAQ